MDGGGGCCIARYSGVGGMSYGMSKVEQIMLKFRPIAPKPMAAGSGSSGSTMENSDGYGRTQRRKRKYVRVNGNKNKKERNTVSKKRKASISSSSVSGGEDTVVTLSLIPETPDRDEKPQSRTTPSETPDLLSLVMRNKPVPISCDHDHVRVETGHVASVKEVIVSPSPPPQPQRRRSEGDSFVTMECVAESWLNGEGVLGFTDEARVMSMEQDACPWFVTNNHDTVVWTNKAYREMTTAGGSEQPAVVMMKKINEVTMPVSHQAFTCKVKITWWPERGSPPALMVPCDVWRLQSGGYAWRLDVKAALSLGR